MLETSGLLHKTGFSNNKRLESHKTGHVSKNEVHLRTIY